MNWDRYGISFFCCILLLSGTFLFRFTVISDQEMEITRLGQSYLESRDKSELDNRFHDSVYKTRQDLQYLIEHLPAFYRFPYVAKEIISLVEKNSLEVSGLLFKPVKTERLDMWQYDSSFSVNGKYADIKSFLSQFIALSGINTLSRAVFSTEEPETGGKIKLDVSVSIYCKGNDR